MQLQVRKKSALRTCIKWSYKLLFLKENNKKIGLKELMLLQHIPYHIKDNPCFFIQQNDITSNLKPEEPGR